MDRIKEIYSLDKSIKLSFLKEMFNLENVDVDDEILYNHILIKILKKYCDIEEFYESTLILLSCNNYDSLISFINKYKFYIKGIRKANFIKLYIDFQV